jgi:hypothetical protein
MPLFTTHNRKRCLIFPLSIATHRGKAGMPRSVQGCFSGTGFGVQKNYIFAAPAKKSGMLFPAFFSQIARAKEWRASWQRKGGGKPKR